MACRLVLIPDDVYSAHRGCRRSSRGAKSTGYASQVTAKLHPAQLTAHVQHVMCCRCRSHRLHRRSRADRCHRCDCLDALSCFVETTCLPAFSLACTSILHQEKALTWKAVLVRQCRLISSQTHASPQHFVSVLCPCRRHWPEHHWSHRLHWSGRFYWRKWKHRQHRSHRCECCSLLGGSNNT